MTKTKKGWNAFPTHEYHESCDIRESSKGMKLNASVILFFMTFYVIYSLTFSSFSFLFPQCRFLSLTFSLVRSRFVSANILLVNCFCWQIDCSLVLLVLTVINQSRWKRAKINMMRWVVRKEWKKSCIRIPNCSR